MRLLLREMLHSPVLDIVQRLKGSLGMSVYELSTAMKKLPGAGRTDGGDAELFLDESTPS